MNRLKRLDKWFDQMIDKVGTAVIVVGLALLITILIFYVFFLLLIGLGVIT